MISKSFSILDKAKISTRYLATTTFVVLTLTAVSVLAKPTREGVNVPVISEPVTEQEVPEPVKVIQLHNNTPLVTSTPEKSSCTQARVDGTTVPHTDFLIYPSQHVVPFYQWENNNGYCGEVSMMQAGLNNGQWMSQFNARLICGTGLSQSGPDNWCGEHHNIPNYNAQLLIEDPDTDVSGEDPYANAATCLANSRLAGKTYPYSTGFDSNIGNLGPAGYEDYMSWVKNEVIAGHQVTVAVLWKYGTDPQYDHTVPVVAIGTNHKLKDGTYDATYYGDDVLYFDDHGVYVLGAKGFPAIPPGSGTDTSGCTPYIFGYTFDSLAKTRSEASVSKAQAYSIVIPGVYPTHTSTGGDGYKGTIKITGHNYGFSVSGAIDNSKGGPYLMPIQLSIPTATYTNGVANPQDPLAGWQYENSMIGKNLMGNGCTNTPPQYWMNPLPLTVTVSGLTPRVRYNLYEFDFNGIAGAGPAAALKVPTKNFNGYYKTSSAKPKRTQFTATGTNYTPPQAVTTTSDKIVVFRAVPASAP